MGRGPSYPYVDLEEAIGLARKVFDYAKRASASEEAVIKEAFGWSITSSGSQKSLAAIRAFGLIEDVPATNGKSIKVTPRTLRILFDEVDSPERKEELRKAALAPKWYDYCWKTWGKEMPPSMKSNLLIEHNFVASTVEGFLKDYRKSIAFAGLLEEEVLSKNNESKPEMPPAPSIGDYVQYESQGILQMPEPRKLLRVEDGLAFMEGSSSGVPMGQIISGEAPPGTNPPQHVFTPAVAALGVQQEGKKMQTATFASTDGVTGQLQWPPELSFEAYEDFLYQIEGLKRKVIRAVPMELRPKGLTSNEELSRSS